jgi:Spy/CpxP family protein refolding chaperone
MNPTRTTAWAIAAIAALWSMSAAAQDAQAPVWTEAPTPHFIVGMTNSAPSLMPEGQREVTVFVFV